MKVLINAISAKMGGFKTLINSFINNVDENDGNHYYFLIYTGVINKEAVKKNNITIIETLDGDMNHLKRFFWYQFILPLYIKKNKYDYMINLTNYGPLFPGCKEILLLHNPKHVSDEIRKSFNINNKIKLLLQDFVFKVSLRGVHKLVVQTNYMKQGVVNKFNYSPDKVIIIPNAPSEFKTSNFDSELDKKINGFIGEEKNVLSNITLYATHKNLETLIKAIKHIKENNLCRLKLMITIDRNENKDAENLINMINDYKIQDYVYSVGNIKHQYVHQILSKSKAFVFPSYAESFGIPFVEAMRFELPIIAADLGFAHDVCDNAAVYFKYDNSVELAKQIVEVLDNDELRKKLAYNSSSRNGLYNEEQVVKNYLSLLK